MNPWNQVQLLELAAGGSAPDGETERKLTVLAHGIDDLWDSINPHNAMEIARSVSRRLPADERVLFGKALAQVLPNRPDYEHELASNSANHCLQRALAGKPQEGDTLRGFRTA